MSEVVFAAYRPKPGKEKDFEEMLSRHTAVLHELELVTSRPRLTLKGSDGTYVEIIEWVDGHAAERAHQHPSVAMVWEAMETVCDFRKMSDLPEAGQPFSHLQVMDSLSDVFN